jgi:hypothetical protein
MSEFGGIFDYHQSMMGFEYLSLAFMAMYGLAAVCVVVVSKARESNAFPSAVADQRKSIAPSG